MKKIIFILLIMSFLTCYGANVRWKDKGNLAGASIAADDYMPITDKSDGNTDKHVTPADIAVYVNTDNADATATFTNKSIDSDDNTITNIVNADIKASAQIVWSKMFNLTADRVLVSTGGDVTVDGTTQTELSILDGATVTTAELNLLDAGETESISDGGATIMMRVNGDDMLYLEDGALIPDEDAEVSLGEPAGKEFMNAYFDGTVTADGLSIDGASGFDGGTFNQNGGTATFNQSSGDHDFIVESDDDAEMIYVDAGNDRVGISTSTPTALLDVDGNTLLQGTATLESMNYAVSAEGDDDYILTLTPALTTLTAGLVIYLNPDVNNTGACTMKVNGLATKNISITDGAGVIKAPSNDDILEKHPAILVYDGTQFMLANPQ